MINFFKGVKLDKNHGGPAISSLTVALIIVMSAIPHEILIYSYNDSYTRQYGHSITIPYAILCTLLLPILKRGRFSLNVYAKRSPLLVYLLYGVFSLVYALFTNVELSFYFVAAFKYILYIMMFILLSSTISLKNYIKGLDIGFKLALFLQTLIGWLYAIAGITIPYIGKYSSSYRNGLSRMEGTFTAPGDFSLYAGILFVYFFYIFLETNRISYFVYAVVAYIDVFLSGARTMLLTVSIIIALVLFYKYRNFLVAKIFLVVSILGGILGFIRSDIFKDLFLEHSFAKMFIARFTHWIIGLIIMFSSKENFLFGVGLNNHVKYIDQNYSMFALLVSSAGDALESEFVRGAPIHNSFLIVGCELGVIGLIMYISIYLYYLRTTIKIIKTNSKYNGICVFIILALALIIIYSFQGWAMMKNFAWEISIIVFALSSLVMRDLHKNKSIRVN